LNICKAFTPTLSQREREKLQLSGENFFLQVFHRFDIMKRLQWNIIRYLILTFKKKALTLTLSQRERG
jgi:hypothetical protein